MPEQAPDPQLRCAAQPVTQMGDVGFSTVATVAVVIGILLFVGPWAAKQSRRTYRHIREDEDFYGDER